ncbi:Cullin repeat-like-containing domain protein [Fimicolochytrium jonesii]|uniref:Cullin repeat-like-containing domain protein n=1 Tax=Fimicolochytrium jonesii TaxID=1396493 RepID=UPI0022FDE605|nr:Cullin repeat-like-containing domain protein [Fimicolochytrium jonesii]KAI8818604.1 Cullin repeat-like-containing domain protein [Fimicolochytrium jonesii]
MVYLESMHVDAQVERRRELERKLHKDMEELEVLEESLAKTNILTNKIESMLSSFDLRLGRLETSILPIHRSTQKLTMFHDHIKAALDQVQTVIDYYDMGSTEEAFIAKGPQESDMKPFLKSVESLKEALVYLQRTKYKASERAINSLKYTLTKALGLLNNVFRKWLTAASPPIDIGNYLDKDIPHIPDEPFRNLLALSLELQTSSIGDLSFPPVYLKIYEEVRSNYLVKSLQGLASATRESELKSAQAKTAYERGTSPMVAYTKALLKMMQAERGLTNKMLPKTNAPTSFQATITPAVDIFVEIGESICSRVKKQVARREYRDVFMLIDVGEGLIRGMREYDGVMAYAGAKGLEISDLSSNGKSITIQCLAQLYEDTKSDNSKGSSLSLDGTVHELTSTALNTLRRLVEYHSAVDKLIADGANPMGATAFSTIAQDVLTALTVNLDQKAKTYKKPTLAAIFLLNNYHYMVKHVRASGLAELVGNEEVGRLEKASQKGRQGYRDSWTSVIEAINDKGQGVAPGAKTLTKAQKHIVKDQFKNFNTEFEEVTRTQKTYSVPDADLRVAIIKDVKAILCPFYKQFYEKHATLDFSKNPEKYVKYTPQTLEAAIEKLFEPGQ